jgi:ubiquinone/menaquinone biosynthesis C-methylase UbiE
MSSFDEIRDAQRDTWNRFAPGWKKWDGANLSMTKPVGEAMLDRVDLRVGHRVLDVATGTGEPGLTAASRVGTGSVIGIDLSEAMTRIANDSARARHLDNYEARVGDACHLPFPDASFDAVVCRFGVMFFPDPPLAVREMVRVLAPGGRLAVSAWGPPPKNPWITGVMEPITTILNLPPPPREAPGMFRYAAPGSLRTLLEDAGVSTVKEEAVDIEHTYESPEQLWQMMQGVAAPLVAAMAGATPAERVTVEQTVLTRLGEQAAGGPLIASGNAWVACGQR